MYCVAFVSSHCQAMSQNMMKMRVVFQGVTVALMVATSGVLGQDILFKDVMPKTNPFSSEAEKK